MKPLAATDYDSNAGGDGTLICNFDYGDNVDGYYRLLNNKARLAGVTTGQGNRAAQYDKLSIQSLSYGFLDQFDSVYDLNRYSLCVLKDPKYNEDAEESTGGIAIIKFNNIATIKIAPLASGVTDDDTRAVELKLVDNDVIHLDTKEKRRSFMSQFFMWKLTQSHA